MKDFLDRRDRMQRLEHHINPYYSRYDKEKDFTGLFDILVVFMVGIILGATIVNLFQAYQRYDNPPVSLKCGKCHNYTNQLVQYFHTNGSKSPQEMADAIIKSGSRNPRLLAAIAKVETNGNPTTRKTGYKKRHDGAYQVNKKHWGNVPHDAIGQTKQADLILEDLSEKKPIIEALNFYGGESILTKHAGDYAGVILAELTAVPKDYSIKIRKD